VGFTMSLLTRADLEQKRERAYRIVSVPHPDPAKAGQGDRVDIRLRSMFGGEWVSMIRSMQGDDKNAEWRSKNYSQLVLAFCLVDEDGKRILTDDDINAAWWKTQSKGFITEAVNEALKFSNLDAGTVEDERKNSPTAGGCDNSTESPQESGQGSELEPPAILSSTLDSMP